MPSLRDSEVWHFTQFKTKRMQISNFNYHRAHREHRGVIYENSLCVLCGLCGNIFALIEQNAKLQHPSETRDLVFYA